jgi:two-component system, chemotaxis family, chemotaxis protein CheY
MGSKKTILCVDDDEIARSIICKFVDITGQYNSAEASSGKECLDFVSKNKVDLIILDYRLGDSDGLNISRIIPSKSLNPDVPIIISSVVDSYEIRTSRGCPNIVKVVQKPYDLASFKQDIDELFGVDLAKVEA